MWIWISGRNLIVYIDRYHRYWLDSWRPLSAPLSCSSFLSNEYCLCLLACLLFVSINDQLNIENLISTNGKKTTKKMNLHNNKELGDLLDLNAVSFFYSKEKERQRFPIRRLNIEVIFPTTLFILHHLLHCPHRYIISFDLHM